MCFSVGRDGEETFPFLAEAIIVLGLGVGVVSMDFVSLVYLKLPDMKTASYAEPGNTAEAQRHGPTNPNRIKVEFQS